MQRGLQVGLAPSYWSAVWTRTMRRAFPGLNEEALAPAWRRRRRRKRRRNRRANARRKGAFMHLRSLYGEIPMCDKPTHISAKFATKFGVRPKLFGMKCSRMTRIQRMQSLIVRSAKFLRGLDRSVVIVADLSKSYSNSSFCAIMRRLSAAIGQYYLIPKGSGQRTILKRTVPRAQERPRPVESGPPDWLPDEGLAFELSDSDYMSESSW